MKKVLIGGAVYGMKNIGDEGLLRGILNDTKGFQQEVMTKASSWLAAEYPSVNQYVWRYFYIKPKFGCYTGERRKLRTWINHFFPDMSLYERNDVFLCGGGTLFSACPWNGYRISMLAKKAHKPTIIWGVGMCNETDKSTIDLLEKWCNDDTVKQVFVRDELVAKRVLNIGVRSDKISVCYDPAYVMDVLPFDLNKLSNKAYQMYTNDNKKIVLTISGERDIADSVNLELMKKYLEYTNKKQYEVFLIPISYSDHTKDRQFLSELDSYGFEHITYVGYEFVPQELVDFLKNIDISVSSRLHMSIYSAMAGTPFVTLKRNEKNSDLAQLYTMPCLPIDGLTVEALVDSTEKLLAERDQLAPKVLQRALFYKKQHQESAVLLRDMISRL